MSKKERDPNTKKLQSDIAIEIVDDYHVIIAKLRADPYVRARGGVTVGPMTNALVEWFVAMPEDERRRFASEALKHYDRRQEELREQRVAAVEAESSPAPLDATSPSEAGLPLGGTVLDRRAGQDNRPRPLKPTEPPSRPKRKRG